MLVLGREAGMSVIVETADEKCVVTLLKVLPGRGKVSVLVHRGLAGGPGDVDIRTVELDVNSSVKIGDAAVMTLVNIRDGNARIGLQVLPGTTFRRLEFDEAIGNEVSDGGDDPSGDREMGTSWAVESADQTCIVTMLKAFPERGKASILVHRVRRGGPGRPDIRMIELDAGSSVKIGAAAVMRLVDIREGKARIGFIVPPRTTIHRSEIWEAIRREKESSGEGADPTDGPGGSGTPGPKPPMPPPFGPRFSDPGEPDADGDQGN